MTCYNITSGLKAQEMAQMAHALVLAFPLNSVFFQYNFSIRRDNLLVLTLFDLGTAYLLSLIAHPLLLLAVSLPRLLAISSYASVCGVARGVSDSDVTYQFLL